MPLNKIVGEGSLNFNLGRLAKISDCVNVNCKLRILILNILSMWIMNGFQSRRLAIHSTCQFLVNGPSLENFKYSRNF